MKLSEAQAKKLMRLAKIKLTEKEIQHMQKDLNKILAYVENLDEVNTGRTKPTNQVTGLKNIRREDKVDYNFSREDMLKPAPAVKDNLIEANKIFE